MFKLTKINSFHFYHLKNSVWRSNKNVQQLVSSLFLSKSLIEHICLILWFVMTWKQHMSFWNVVLDWPVYSLISLQSSADVNTHKAFRNYDHYLTISMLKILCTYLLRFAKFGERLDFFLNWFFLWKSDAEFIVRECFKIILNFLLVCYVNIKFSFNCWI